VNLPVGPTRSVFVTNLQSEETQNPQCLQQGLKLNCVPQTFLFVPGEWCVVHP
jgi:hypothetical protein